MDFRILGPLEVLSEERVLDVGGGKQRGLLALLLIHANEVVSSDRLIDGLWPEQQPASAAKIIHAHVSRLRKALAIPGDGILVTHGNGYVLNVEPGHLDVDRFRQLLDQGREALAAGDPDRAAEVLQRALALWRGPALVDFAYDSFAQEEIARLEDLHLAALEERIEADLALGRHDDVLQELNELVRQHPLRERLRGQLMLALYRAGRQADALEVYREGRRRLADDLGLEPSPSLQQLERAILTHDPALEAPTRTSGSDRARRRRSPPRGWCRRSPRGRHHCRRDRADRQRRGPRPRCRRCRTQLESSIPQTNTIVDQIPVGAAPTAIATGRQRRMGDQPAGPDRHAHRPRTRTTRSIHTRLPTNRRTARRWTSSSATRPSGCSIGFNRCRWRSGCDRPRRARPQSAAGRRRDSASEPGPSFGSGHVQSLAASDGALWAGSPSRRTAITRIDETTQKPVVTFPPVDPNYGFNGGSAGGIRGSSGIAVGAGSVWVGSDAGVIRMARIGSVMNPPFPLGPDVIPTAITFGDGAVWVVSRPGFRCPPCKTVGTGTLTKIDPATNEIVEDDHHPRKSRGGCVWRGLRLGRRSRDPLRHPREPGNESSG